MHAAVNKEKLNLVEILLKSLSNEETSRTKSDDQDKKFYKLDVNRVNEKCMGATALHLAVWNDYNEIALVLMQANADPWLKMNDKNAFEMARDSSNQVLYELLSEYSNLRLTNSKSEN